MPMLLVTGGAGFVLCNVVHRWLEADPESSAVVMDLSRAWDATVVGFLQPYLDDGRLQFFETSVADASGWAGARGGARHRLHPHGTDTTRRTLTARHAPWGFERVQRRQ